MEHQQHNGMSLKHLLAMMLCCLIPIFILAALFYGNLDRAYLPFLFVLLCPLMMLLMYLPRILARKKTESHHLRTA